MITLINGFPQGPNGLIVPNGSVGFQLNVDAVVIGGSGGFVSASIEVVFQFDATGHIQPNSPAAAAQIYSNKELNPQNSVGLGTYYLVTFYDANGARINKNPMWWQFPEAAGSTVDISNITPISTVGGNVIFYPTSFGGGGTVTSVSFTGEGTIFSNTPSAPVTTSGTLTPTLLTQSANTFLAGPSSGPASAPTFRGITAADLPPAANVWSSLLSATANLTLANTSFSTTFNQTTAASWTWANITAATNTVPQNSPILDLSGTYWNGSASATDTWSVEVVLGSGTNPVSTLTFLHAAGTSGGNAVSFPGALNVAGTATAGISIAAQGAFGFEGDAEGSVFTLSAAGNASAGLTTYTGTLPPGGTPNKGQWTTIAGFTNGANNGRFVVSSATVTTLVVFNGGGVAESHAATATMDGDYVSNAGFDVNLGGKITFPLFGGPFTTNAAFAAIPYFPGITITAKADVTDAAYLRIINDGATGNHGLEIGGIIDGTGTAPVLFQLGHFNGSSSATLNAKFSSYNGITLAGNGLPSEPFQILSTGLTANYNAGSAQTIFTPSGVATLLRITATEAITTAATTGAATSTLPSLTIGWTDEGGIARTFQLLATSTTNTTAVFETGSLLIHTNTSTVVTVTSASYASNTAAQMAYTLAVAVEIL